MLQLHSEILLLVPSGAYTATLDTEASGRGVDGALPLKAALRAVVAELVSEFGLATLIPAEIHAGSSWDCAAPERSAPERHTT